MYSINIPGTEFLGNFGKPTPVRKHQKIFSAHTLGVKPDANPNLSVPFQEILANTQEIIKTPTTGSPSSTKIYNAEDVQSSYSLQCKKNNSPIYASDSNSVPGQKIADDKWYYIGAGFIIMLIFLYKKG